MKLPQYRLLKISSSRKGTSIEAEWVDLVTCGDCKHWCKGDEVYGICYRCPNTRQMRYDDFCSYGVKKGADDE